MKETLIVALRTTVVTLVVTGIVYPLVMTGAAQVLFRGRANGSLVLDEHGQVVGSEIIAQPFSSPAYFHPRPSAAGANGYDAAGSSGSNLGPTSAKLKERVAADLAKLRAENPEAPADVPADLVTTSGSGLDPHLSPEAAHWQVSRVARARGVASDRIRAIVEAETEGRGLGVLGEPRVNVLLINLALDRQFGRPSSTALPPSPR